jgi:cytochrome c oxidase assembly protein subunit 15
VFAVILGALSMAILIALVNPLTAALTFALLSYVALALTTTRVPTPAQRDLKRAVVAGLVLLAGQIALGGWTSANYAALACGFDFPHCQGQWWPPADFREGFVLWRGVGVNYEGGVLDSPARAAIQIAHRIGALVVFCWLAWLAHRLASAKLRGIGIALGALLIAQVSLGIGNVKLGLPLPVATAHNGVAALLLFTLIAALVRVSAPDRE